MDISLGFEISGRRGETRPRRGKKGGETVPFDPLDRLWWTSVVTVASVIESVSLPVPSRLPDSSQLPNFTAMSRGE